MNRQNQLHYPQEVKAVESVESSLSMSSPSAPLATPDVELDVHTLSSENLPWLCIVWDDPVNLMSYVTYVFQTVLGFSKKRATDRKSVV